MLSYIEIPEGCSYGGFIITFDTFGVEVCKLFRLFFYLHIYCCISGVKSAGDAVSVRILRRNILC